MELKEGMYVRTKYGISKIDEDRRIDYGIINPVIDILKEEAIFKASNNIIDLIEVGDYVNGHKVCDDFRLDTDDYGNNFIEIGIESDKFLNHYIREDEIETIVTKEQFESMSYKVEE